jgi:hypothetical protein
MNTAVTTHPAGWHAPSAWSAARDAVRRVASRTRVPPLVLGLALAVVALLLVYVHLLQQQVLRGEQLREQQRQAALHRPAKAEAPTPSPHHVVMPARKRTPVAPAGTRP